MGGWVVGGAQIMVYFEQAKRGSRGYRGDPWTSAGNLYPGLLPADGEGDRFLSRGLSTDVLHSGLSLIFARPQVSSSALFRPLYICTSGSQGCAAPAWLTGFAFSSPGPPLSLKRKAKRRNNAADPAILVMQCLIT